MVFRFLQRHKERNKRLTEADWKSAYAATFSNEGAGRMVLQDLMDRFHFFRFVRPAPDTENQMAFIEGQRSVVLHILDRLQVTTIEDLKEKAEG